MLRFKVSLPHQFAATPTHLRLAVMAGSPVEPVGIRPEPGNPIDPHAHVDPADPRPVPGWQTESGSEKSNLYPPETSSPKDTPADKTATNQQKKDLKAGEAEFFEKDGKTKAKVAKELTKEEKEQERKAAAMREGRSTRDRSEDKEKYATQIFAGSETEVVIDDAAGEYLLISEEP